MLYLEDIKLKHFYVIIEHSLMQHFHDNIKIEKISQPIEEIEEYDNDELCYEELFEVEFYVGKDTSKLEHFQLGWDCNQEQIFFLYDMNQIINK